MRNGCSSCWAHSLSDRLCCLRCPWIGPEWSEEYGGAKGCRARSNWPWHSVLAYFTVMMENFHPVLFFSFFFFYCPATLLLFSLPYNKKSVYSCPYNHTNSHWEFIKYLWFNSVWKHICWAAETHWKCLNGASNRSEPGYTTVSF